MEIPNPRRILAVSLEDSTHLLSKVIKGETGVGKVPFMHIGQPLSTQN